jgi:hypothetical protein
MRPGSGAAYTPGSWCSHGRRFDFGHHCRFPAADPVLRYCSHLPESSLTRLTAVHQVHPSGLPLACDPWMRQRSLGVLPGSTPRRYQRRMPGAGTGIEHLPGASRRPYRPSFFQPSHSHSATSCRTEPDEPEHRDHGQHAEGSQAVGGQASRGQHGEAEVPARRVGQPGRGLAPDDQDLDGQQHAKHPAGDVHPEQSQQRDHEPGGQRPRPPRCVHTQVRRRLGLRGRAERAIQPDLKAGVRQQRHQRGRDPATRPIPCAMNA